MAWTSGAMAGEQRLASGVAAWQLQLYARVVTVWGQALKYGYCIMQAFASNKYSILHSGCTWQGPSMSALPVGLFTPHSVLTSGVPLIFWLLSCQGWL